MAVLIFKNHIQHLMLGGQSASFSSLLECGGHSMLNNEFIDYHICKPSCPYRLEELEKLLYHVPFASHKVLKELTMEGKNV